ncbi:hypothetical protein K1719_022751 [Acacia pycnantha]|nr:hypothetical protein K1719_022751 [Acacia pycnantha]
MAKSVVLIFIISLIVLCVGEGRVNSPDSDPHRSVHNPPHLAASSPEQSRHNDFDDQLCKGLGREECLTDNLTGSAIKLEIDALAIYKLFDGYKKLSFTKYRLKAIDC